MTWNFKEDPPKDELLLLLLEREASPDLGDPGTMHELTVYMGWVDGSGFHGLRIWQPDGAVLWKMQDQGWRITGWQRQAELVFEARDARRKYKYGETL